MRAAIVAAALAVLICCTGWTADAYPLAITISNADRKVRTLVRCLFRCILRSDTQGPPSALTPFADQPRTAGLMCLALCTALRPLPCSDTPRKLSAVPQSVIDAYDRGAVVRRASMSSVWC